MLTGRLGRPDSNDQIGAFFVSKPATAHATSAREESTTKLAKFFPDATPVHMPVRLTRVAGGSKPFTENTLIEFGTPREVLFASTLPLEFADKLRLQNADGSLDAEACVVALQYNTGRTAVAARFVREVSNWIIKL